MSDSFSCVWVLIRALRRELNSGYESSNLNNSLQVHDYYLISFSYWNSVLHPRAAARLCFINQKAYQHKK